MSESPVFNKLDHIAIVVRNTDDVRTTFAELPARGMAPKNETPHDGVLSKKAGFIDPAKNPGVIWEMTGPR